MLPPGDTVIPFNCKLRLLPNHFGFLIPLNQKTEKGVSVLAVVIDLDYQREVGLLLHNGDEEECVLSTGDPLGHLLILPCPMIKVNGKLQTIKDRITRGPNIQE